MRGPEVGWDAPEVIAAIIGAVVLLAGFVARLCLAAEPLKGDSRDAEVIASALRTDRRCFRLGCPTGRWPSFR
ncbi:hypothetical protein [Nitratireductor luteus]|uniref:hypothetical protein n=1 Tax=Nitratireductor luteus TaxID=2976980 RepID=UPI00223F8C7A|nr:hypothetical protein [Nitratireductor luteus]